MYRSSNSFGGARPAATAPRSAWEQAERILEILERDPIQPPDTPYRALPFPAAPGAPDASSKPIAARIDEWLRKPLRESNYLRGMGIAPDDPFWDTYDDPRGNPRLEIGDPLPELAGPSYAPAPSPAWQYNGGGPHPLPLPQPGEDVWRTWDFNPEQHGDRPLETLLRGSEPPTVSEAPDRNGYDYGIPVPPPAPETADPAPDDDQPPRIVAVVPHRNDREIADEIWAKLQAEQKSTEPDTQPESPYGAGNLFGLIGSAQAQARSTRGPRPTLTPAQYLRLRYYRSLQHRLNELEPPQDQVSPDTAVWGTWVPSDAELRRMEDTLTDAIVRAGQPRQARRGGDSLEAIVGDAVHKDYRTLFQLPDHYILNQPLPSGRRPDAIGTENLEVRELKPNSPSGIRRGEQQLGQYRKEYSMVERKPVQSKLDTYDFLEMLKRYLGLE